MKEPNNVFVLFVNGKKFEDANVDPEWTLIRYLREKLRLPGTKLGCSEGGCGACTVMVSKMETKTESPPVVRHYTLNACLAPVVMLHGLSVTTVEGIGSTKTKLHPVQERLSKSHGSQCGFCTPGIVMSMYTLLRNYPLPTMDQIEENLVGNLCRCTGYRPILEGFRTFSSDAMSNMQSGCGKKNCCQLKEKNAEGSDDEKGMEMISVLYDPASFQPYDPTQDIIFPPELMTRSDLRKCPLQLKGPRVTHYRPCDLKELLTLKITHNDAKIIGGNTEIGVEVKYKNQHYPITIDPSLVEELYQLHVLEDGVEVGASVSLSNIEFFFKEVISNKKDHQTRVLVATLEMLRWFAGRQIRNAATLGGNIMTGSPISDINPILMAAGAILHFRCLESEREVILNAEFFTGYRKNIVRPDEVLMSIKIPFTSEDQYFFAYKQSRRRDDDIAIVNAAFNIEFQPKSLIVQKSLIAFGGMAATTVMAPKTMENLKRKQWNAETLESATSSLLQEMSLDPSAPGGMVEYRRALAASFMFKMFMTVKNQQYLRYPELGVENGNIEGINMSKTFKPEPISSVQFFQKVSSEEDRIDPVGWPKNHLSSQKQVTGEAVYVDDMPMFADQLHGALVRSAKARAKIISIDEAEALKMDGVEAFFCAKDLPDDRNVTGGIWYDEEVFASEEVVNVGQVIGLIVANDPLVALIAAKKVKVTYEIHQKPILTIADAIAAGSIWRTKNLSCGDVTKAFEAEDCQILEGEVQVGGQEHFYMETNAHIAIPLEGDDMEIFSCTQSTNNAQILIAKALGISRNRVVVRTKRLGGGFGGKETKPQLISVPIALAAYRLRRPVRIMIDRQDDMEITAGRHPFLAKWKVGFTKEGKITAYEVDLYVNGGSSKDLTASVMIKGLLSSDNAYKIPNMKVTGFSCFTNLASNSAFRGFGAPQGMFVTENAVAQVAEHLKMDPLLVRSRNLYSEGDLTHFGQKLDNCTVKSCWNLVLEQADYQNRLEQVDEFNRNNRYRKRGISAIPTMYGICFFELTAATPFLNQAGALVLIYTDGSVLLSHGGIEMGQGLHTKMIQVASRALGLPMGRIHTMEAATDKVPNPSPSAASSSSDLNGGAVLDACNKITSRLEPYKLKAPEEGWDSWVKMAYLDRVSLSATGFYRTPDITTNLACDGSPVRIFNYFSAGAAVSEVEIDCLTGDYHILRTDIVMDVGRSLNPAIDIGQIEGAFMQGVGLFTLEELKYSPEGDLLTKGPGAYKIPGFQDIPRAFNVTLLKDAPNPRAVYSSKAVGEPPLFLAGSVFHAIRSAVSSARQGTNRDDVTPFRLDSPATCERIRMACEDAITDRVNSEAAKPGTYKPWSISVN